MVVYPNLQEYWDIMHKIYVTYQDNLGNFKSDIFGASVKSENDIVSDLELAVMS